MADVSILPYAEIGRNDHRENAFHFNTISIIFTIEKHAQFLEHFVAILLDNSVSGGSEIGRNFLKHNKIST